MTKPQWSALIDYEDPYVQPLIVSALERTFPANFYNLISNEEDCGPHAPLLQIRAYESLNFERCQSKPNNLCNAYVIRKALIRKHYLSNTIFSWVTKHPDSVLRKHFKAAEELELDYAEFLDDALVEAFDLRAAFDRNEHQPPERRDWWILKPGMSDRGQGIRLFSTQEELQRIFEEWEVDDDDEEEEDEEDDSTLSMTSQEPKKISRPINNDGIVTSHLRHFLVQPYIHPPLLIADPPFRNRKFHIRTYVVAAGALQVYVYNHMLALFASKPYQPPWETETLPNSYNEETNNSALENMKNIHLTNTCVQTASRSSVTDSVYLLSSLPLSTQQHDAIRAQIHETTAEMFRTALAQPTNFQAVPTAFEIFGVDFLLEDTRDEEITAEKADLEGKMNGNVNVQLLEVNAFPDFAQTGEELRDVVVRGLFEEIMRVVVGPFFAASVGDDQEKDVDEVSRLIKVLDVDLGRR